MNLLKKREKQLVEGIDLFNGVKARRTSKEDFEDFKATPMFLALSKKIPLGMFVLEKYITIEKEHEFDIDQIMRNIVLALRLLKKGYVYGSLVVYILVSEKRLLTSSSIDEQQRQELLGYRYTLNFDEIPTLKKLIKKIQKINFSKRKSLHLACKRFQRAYEKGDAEDQLIDFMIAFEALFLKGEKAMSPAGQIIAIACSTLLGRNDEEREEIRSFMNKAHTIRNYIVHGAEYKKKFEIFDFVPKIEGYLRESIKKLLD